LVLSALLIISIAAWIYGRWGNLTMPKTTRAISSAFAFILTISSLYASIGSFDRFATTRGVKQTSSLHGINWQPYSEKLVNESLQDGKAVFIDFTAAWCLSCQVNEKVAFSSLEVQQKIKESGIITLKGDWTSRDEKITKALAGFGRNSVPLYVFYPGNGKPPLLLPELLTPGIVLDFFNKINVQSPITLN
jgi:thiol:disulfide interchange protein DsbD